MCCRRKRGLGQGDWQPAHGSQGTATQLATQLAALRMAYHIASTGITFVSCVSGLKMRVCMYTRLWHVEEEWHVCSVAYN